ASDGYRRRGGSHRRGHSPLFRKQAAVDRQRRHGAVGGGTDGELWTGRDVAGGKDVENRGVAGMVDDDVPLGVAVAAELHAQVVGGVLGEGEEDLLAAQWRATVELQR